MTSFNTSSLSKERLAKRVMLSTAISATALLLPASAFAQAVSFDEIVTTARRVTENLQTTPVAVTSLGGEAIENRQITDVNAIQY
ncbi:MAG: hypothetical protein EX271_08195, partial [Acidimicrobiales bacterium]